MHNINSLMYKASIMLIQNGLKRMFFQNILHLFLFSKQKPILVSDWGLTPPPVYGPVRNFFFTPSLTTNFNCKSTCMYVCIIHLD